MSDLKSAKRLFCAHCAIQMVATNVTMIGRETERNSCSGWFISLIQDSAFR